MKSYRIITKDRSQEQKTDKDNSSKQRENIINNLHVYKQEIYFPKTMSYLIIINLIRIEIKVTNELSSGTIIFAVNNEKNLG